MRLEELVDQHYHQLSANDRELIRSIFKEKTSVSTMNKYAGRRFFAYLPHDFNAAVKKTGAGYLRAIQTIISAKGKHRYHSTV